MTRPRAFKIEGAGHDRRLDQIRKHDVLATGRAERLALVGPRPLEAGLLGSLVEGLWKVE